MKSEREKIYEKIEAIGGMEELEKMVARKKPYGGYEAMVESNAEYFSRVRAEEEQRQNLEVKCATCHMHGATHGELCEWCYADAENRKLWDNAQDQDYKKDAGKVRLSTVPASLERSVAEIRAVGIAKYGDNERWREVSVERYFDALLRHVNAMREHGLESVDAESGSQHAKHAACNIAFIIDILEKQQCPSVNTARNHG